MGDRVPEAGGVGGRWQVSCACKIGGGPNGVCLECRRAAHFSERLKKLESYREDAIAEGRRLERAAIVAALRARAADSKMDGLSEGLWWAADRIERGEHTKEAT